MEVQEQMYLLNVAIVDNLPADMILGRDLPVLYELLQPTLKTLNILLPPPLSICHVLLLLELSPGQVCSHCQTWIVVCCRAGLKALKSHEPTAA